MKTSGPTDTTLNLGQSLTIFQHSHGVNDLFLVLVLALYQACARSSYTMRRRNNYNESR